MHGATEAVPVRFDGDAREYFGIWTVNVLLSIATLGIYSAWAKVRTRKYFLGNTSIDGRPFGYHATGRQVLIGRAIVVGLFGAMGYWSSLDPGSSAGSLGFSLIAIPFLIDQGLRFNASVTSWSNIRFRFGESEDTRKLNWQAIRIFGIYPLLAAFTLFLAFPFVARATKRYIVEGHSLGGHRFSFDSGIGPFYRAFLLSAAWVVAVLAISFALYLLAWFALGLEQAAPDDSAVQSVGIPVLGVIVLIAVLPLAAIHNAFVRHAISAGASLAGGHRFASTASATTIVWIAIGNAMAVVLSLGMLLPWAQIRMARYLCANTWIGPAGTLDRFLDAAQDR